MFRSLRVTVGKGGVREDAGQGGGGGELEEGGGGGGPLVYSHSVVPGGLEVKSNITLEMPGIFLISLTIFITT